MTSQLDRDWEEQQHGLQGTVTGSMHNQIGLDSRLPGVDTSSPPRRNDKARARPKNTGTDSHQRQSSSQSQTDFNVPTAILGFAAACYWLYEPAQESPWPMLIGAGLAGALCGRFYKPLWGLVIAGGALYLLGFYDG